MTEVAVERDWRRRENRRLLVRLSIVAVLMFGFAFALVPFYRQICEALGINVLVKSDSAGLSSTQVDYTRKVTIEFDANTRGLPWSFISKTRSMEVHPGQLVQMDYEIANVRDRPVTGQAIPSYAPRLSGQYFKKLNCFCFAQQTLAAGETRTMPVVFVIDPALPADTNTVTLSYTFFEVPGLNEKR